MKDELEKFFHNSSFTLHPFQGVSQKLVTRPHLTRKFITTEPLGKSGEGGEQLVWDAIREVFADRDCIGYWRYPIFSKVGKSRKEPDILIADSSLGLIVIEIKSVTIEQILAIAGHRWEFQNFYTTSSNPYEQAENQLFALLGYGDREPSLRRKVSGRAFVCLPLITEDQWYQSGFYQLPSCPPIIFQNNLCQESRVVGAGLTRMSLGMPDPSLNPPPTGVTLPLLLPTPCYSRFSKLPHHQRLQSHSWTVEVAASRN
jgi:hypothetical protein